MQWVKGIENLNVSRFRAQGIVGAAVIIPTFTVSFQREGSLSMSPPGFAHGTASFFL